jgi:flagellar P-ring protein precursor FlgI
MNRIRRALAATEQGFMRGLQVILLAVTCSLVSVTCFAERIKDIANMDGVRSNQLYGYGLVVGLDGTGDQTTSTPFTVQALLSMLTQMNIQLPSGTSLQLKNVAAVTVTATLPPFAKPGQQIDVTVSSIGNAKSLRGGTLLMSPLKAADGEIYALAQGNILVGGAGASGGGSSTQINHLAAGRVPGGATVERAVPALLVSDGHVNLELKESDFTTSARVAETIDRAFGPGTAHPIDGRLIKVRAPLEPGRHIGFLAQLENLQLNPALPTPRVIINARTGSVVMNQLVNVDLCAIAHGNLTVTVNADKQVSQPNALAGGETVVTETADVQIKSDKGELVVVPATASLNEVVKALNTVGATPQDLLAILQAMKAAGALKADLEII